MGFVINSEMNDFCVVDFSLFGGIYLVDCKDVFIIKIVKNGLIFLRIVYDVIVISKGKLVFFDLDVRKVGKVDFGVVNYIVRLGIDLVKDCCEKIVFFV